MNVSAAHNLIPYFGYRQDPVMPNQGEAEDYRSENQLVPAQNLSHGENTKYNYYVLSSENDTVYNQKKSTEKINSGLTGHLIDIYV